MFFKNINELQLSIELTFNFLRSAALKLETEVFALAFQDAVINTLAYRSHIFHSAESTLCQICHYHIEILMYVLSTCPSLALSGYVYSQNTALHVIYHHLRYAYDIDTTTVIP